MTSAPTLRRAARQVYQTLHTVKRFRGGEQGSGEAKRREGPRLPSSYFELYPFYWLPVPWSASAAPFFFLPVRFTVIELLSLKVTAASAGICRSLLPVKADPAAPAPAPSRPPISAPLPPPASPPISAPPPALALAFHADGIVRGLDASRHAVDIDRRQRNHESARSLELARRLRLDHRPAHARTGRDGNVIAHRDRVSERTREGVAGIGCLGIDGITHSHHQAGSGGNDERRRWRWRRRRSRRFRLHVVLRLRHGRLVLRGWGVAGHLIALCRRVVRCRLALTLLLVAGGQGQQQHETDNERGDSGTHIVSFHRGYTDRNASNNVLRATSRCAPEFRPAEHDNLKDADVIVALCK